MEEWLYDPDYYEGMTHGGRPDETAQNALRFDEQGVDPDHFSREEPEIFLHLFCSVYFEGWQDRFWKLISRRSTDPDFEFHVRALVAAGCGRFYAIRGMELHEKPQLLKQRRGALLDVWRLERSLAAEKESQSQASAGRLHAMRQQHDSRTHELAMRQQDLDLDHDQTLRQLKANRQIRLEGLEEKKQSLVQQIADEKAKASAAQRETADIQTLLDQFMPEDQ